MADLESDVILDPDAQATVTDFLDYTEYLPSDILRSLTLIRGLDETYLLHSENIHGLTKQYGGLLTVPAAMRPDPNYLRSTISTHLDRALTARESAYAEAGRLLDVAERHYNRLNSIISKLHALPKPPSRDPTPQPSRSPDAKRSRSGRKIDHGVSAQRLTLNPPRAPAIAAMVITRPRGRRITVPGEVLPPYDPDSTIASTEVTDWESEPPSPIRPVLKLKQIKPPKVGIDSSKKASERRELTVPYKKPTPPPEDAELGGKYRPWLRLTEYEMYRLRKKMKKNHNWEPSDIMVKRELQERGRGMEQYQKAKAEAQEKGIKFLDVDIKGQLGKAGQDDSGAIVNESFSDKAKVAKRPEPKNPKRDTLAREQATQAAQEAELAARRLGDIGSAFKNLFSPLSNALASLNRSASSPTSNGATSTVKKAASRSRKRKLDEVDVSASPSIEIEPTMKKPKAAPKASPLPSIDSPTPADVKIPLKLTVPTAPSALSSTETPVATSRAGSVRAASIAPKSESSPPPISRPPSRRSAAASIEPTGSLAMRQSRRTSTPATGLRGTPVVETTPKTAASRRSRREAPGTVTQTSQDGGAAVSLSKRKVKPQKQIKAGPAPKESDGNTPRTRTDIDGKQEVINPDEETYCICGDVSWGEMILCELDDKCQYGQWFHMECVNLIELPPRTVKWYCPGDRKKEKKGENSNGLVGRGIK